MSSELETTPTLLLCQMRDRIADLETQLADARAEPARIVAFMRTVAEKFPTHELLHFIGDAWTGDGAELARRFATAIENGSYRNG